MKKKKKLAFPGIEKINGKLLTLLIIITSLYVCLGISTILLIAYYGVPMGDDYLAIKTFENPSTWLSEAWLSFSSTSRYLQSIASSVAYGVLGHKIGLLLPIIVLIWFFVLAYLYLRLGFKKLRLAVESWKVYCFSAAIIVLLVISGEIAISTSILFSYQQFFFSSAIVTYTLCVLGFLTLFYLYLRYSNIIKRYPRTAFVTFITTSFLLSFFNETTPASILATAVMLLTLSFFRFPILRVLKKSRVYLIGLAGANLVALILMYLSPARAARSSVTGGLQSPNIIEPALNKTLEALSFYFTPTTLGIIVLVSFVVTMALVQLGATKKAFSHTLIFGLIATLAGVLSLFVAMTLLVLGYGATSSIYPRTLLLVQILLILGLTIATTGGLGLLATKLPKRASAYTILTITLAMLFISITSATGYIDKISNALSITESYHSTWKSQDELLRNAAATKPNETIFLPDEGAGIGDGFSIACHGPYSKNTIWLTDGMEAYYGVKEICAESDLKDE